MLSSAVKDSVGFDHVDAHVTNVMIGWIGGVVRQTCRELLALHKKLPFQCWTAQNRLQTYSDADNPILGQSGQIDRFNDSWPVVA